MFQENMTNTMATDALGPYIARTLVIKHYHGTDDIKWTLLCFSTDKDFNYM